MNWEIYFKTEDQHKKLYTLKNMSKGEIKRHLKSKFQYEIENNLKVELIEYPEESKGGLPYSVEYCLSDDNYYVFGFHAFQLENE